MFVFQFQQECPAAIAVIVWKDVPNLEWWVVGGLGLFGFAFAVVFIHASIVLALPPEIPVQVVDK